MALSVRSTHVHKRRSGTLIPSVLLRFEEAWEIVLDAAWRLPRERATLADGPGRVLAEGVIADMDLPPFSKAMVDGYACRRADLPGELEQLEVIAAGSSPRRPVREGTCSKIMTGAPMPEGADCVVMVEQAQAANGGRVYFSTAPVRSNVAARGEDLQAGSEILSPGLLLAPQHMGLLATAGACNPLVSRRPRVAVLATGDELTAPDMWPGPAQIRNSNSVQLAALARSVGCEVRDLGILRDDRESLRIGLEEALAESDVVLSTGGVSMGDFDLVPDVLVELGLEPKVRKVAIQPGKPMFFAKGRLHAAFGLSGNPVSSYVQFILFVRPFLLAMQGVATSPATVRLPMAETLTRKNTDRMAWQPVRIYQGVVHGLDYHGSAHLAALRDAQGLVAFPIGIDALEAGEEAAVALF